MSPAQIKFFEGVQRAAKIREAAFDARLRPISRERSQTFSHASLTALVASWDAYLNLLVETFYSATANPANPAFQCVHEIAQQQSEEILKRFNTPNWENSRNLLVRTTGFDPAPAWIWPARNMSRLQVHERLNEILKVRHAFAHGLGMPSYTWNRTPRGNVRLNATVLRETEAFFTNLVKGTDAGMRSYLATHFAIQAPW